MRLVVPLLTALLLVGGCSSDEPGDAAGDDVTPSPTMSESSREPELQPPADDQHVAPARGPVSFSATASCVEDYSPEAMTGRAFAFAGTVTEIGESVTDRGDSGDLGYSGVTFQVEEWFVGDGPATFTVDMGAPTKSRMSESAPSYFVGSRLLVSGEDRWGEGGLEDPIAWGCGFTRYFDESTSAAWRSAS